MKQTIILLLIATTAFGQATPNPPPNPVTITLSVPGEVYQLIQDYCKERVTVGFDSVTKATKTAPRCASPESLIAGWVQENLARIVDRHPSAAVQQLRKQISEIQQQVNQAARPAVTATKP